MKWTTIWIILKMLEMAHMRAYTSKNRKQMESFEQYSQMAYRSIKKRNY